MSPGRSALSVVACALASLVLTVTLGTWLKAHEERSTLAASHDVTALVTSAIEVLPTSSVTPPPSPPPMLKGVVPASTPPTDARRIRTAEGIAFSFSAHHSWVDGPINELLEGEFRQGRLLISKSIVGPQGAEAIIYWTGVTGGPRAEPCGHWWDPTIDGVADLATAVATAPEVELVTGPSDVTVGGYPAKRVVVTTREDGSPCDPGFFYTWYSECWGPCWVETNVGDTIRVWIVDVDGTPLFFAAETTTQASHRLVREIQQIVGSIRFN